ncbi:AraC family transcriptional regulator [Paraburkholderia sp. J63]|uniref:AraC family transcriptional regulator n=1 Tax=Paraburkholderia sp. J63 TaxID=2805434 RepID=UPI002ABDED2B|nr:AraC family transcriptional regulator [Paraburkholderia sp. J63]
MLDAPITIPVVFVHGMLSGLRRRGESCDRFLEAADIPTSLLDDPGARITAAQYVALFKSVIDLRKDECLGLLSRPLKPGSFALVVRAAATAPDLEVAIRRLAKTFQVLQDDVVIEMPHRNRLVGLALRFQNPDDTPIFLHELLLRVFWQLAAWLAGGKLPPASFDFAFDVPEHAAQYSAIFPASHHFRQSRTTLWFDETWLSSPVRRDRAALREFLADAESRMVIPQQSSNIVSARVCAYLSRTQPEWPDLTVAASAMNMSVATLQRRLAVEGTSFQALKDELRRDIAIMRLNTTNTTLAQLAEELGFTDSAAFQRAFKRWVGNAPGAYRRKDA